MSCLMCSLEIREKIDVIFVASKLRTKIRKSANFRDAIFEHGNFMKFLKDFINRKIQN